ncbi:hypothetical protein F2981_17630 [Sinorhizobium meliloti]|nr:hypothetical protein [Sinorhizobium meliloti]
MACQHRRACRHRARGLHAAEATGDRSPRRGKGGPDPWTRNTSICLSHVAAAVATYVTRFVARAHHSAEVHSPAIESALNAVPAAVLTTLVGARLHLWWHGTSPQRCSSLRHGLRLSTLRMLLVGWIASWRSGT